MYKGKPVYKGKSSIGLASFTRNKRKADYRGMCFGISNSTNICLFIDRSYHHWIMNGRIHSVVLFTLNFIILCYLAIYFHKQEYIKY